MLFNSFEFIFLFFPITVFLYFYGIRHFGKELGIALLVICSLFFYGWWNPVYLLLLLFSIVFNYWIGSILGGRKSKQLLTFGIVVNLGLIAYFKYALFVLTNVAAFTNATWQFEHIVLPLAISFFTFQQIAYLVDSYRGITKEYNFLHYALFVSFFPQLIAGPIVHHRQMLPQFQKNESSNLLLDNILIGFSIFAIGLFKKTVLADGIADYANPVFNSANNGVQLDFFTAWGGVLSYTFQLYFDFSGYSDMAIGLARVFGIVLPLNFYSPYKATSIVEFWRRWHITLSTFLRDYLYIALGGNRSGVFSRYRNLFVTMLIGGLWHGAGWNFILWGCLHGGYLIVNHSWSNLQKRFNLNFQHSFVYTLFAWSLTFLAVVVGWVFFRAETLQGGWSLLQSMAGVHGISLPNALWIKLDSLTPLFQALGMHPEIGGGAVFVQTWLWIFGMLLVCLMLPNVQDIFCNYRGSLASFSHDKENTFWPYYKNACRIIWQPSQSWAALCVFMLICGLLTLFQVSEFLYFRF